ncbi:sporulation inhibitor of replication protein SirA [Bacillus sp. 123MFChir2]|uniref:sporulation inhibitor of replication protein SirA n=1 Tax=Bacillus sp. 123MFChir2 TaxID=1169144 RepID=UPI000361B903|nr:sporulation inhibitor of replication protein SirA [Bacillus sp. 123MFChir2]
MRTYELYLIREDITKAYFGREFLLFDLFARFAQSRSLSEKKVLYKQMKYITLPLQVMKLHHKMEQALRTYGEYERNGYMHMVSNKNAYGEVRIKSQYIRMHASENVELETAIFEVLRKCELTFLAMDYESKQYGWLNPLKQVRTYI